MEYLLSKTGQEIGGVYVHLTTKFSACYFSFTLLFVFSSYVCLIRFSIPSSVNIIFRYPNITCKIEVNFALFDLSTASFYILSPPFLLYTNRMGELVDLRTGLDTWEKDVFSCRKLNPDSPVVDPLA